MATKRLVQRVADSLGATLRITNDGNTTDDRKEVCAEAPHGYIWRDGSVHELVESDRGTVRMGDVYASILDRMNMGVDKCEDHECEWCLDI